MVKRAITLVAGAAAGAALWFIVSAWASGPSDPEPSVVSCVREALIDCVGYEAPAPAQASLPDAPPIEIIEPCKGWLSATGDGAMALLSQCLHEARRGTDRAEEARKEEARRKRAIAASS